MAGPFFSVVIPTYNRCEAVLRCLDALARQSLEMDQFEVIVVVDGSTDGTTAKLGSLNTSSAPQTTRVGIRTRRSAGRSAG